MNNFPAYVPAGARAHINRILHGDDQHWQGLNAFVVEYRARGDAAEALQGLEREVAVYQRFASDPRMRNVYAELAKVFTSDDQFGHFLRSANGADVNFAPFRERVKQAKNLAPKIAAVARELAGLLVQAGKLGGGMAPSEFYSISALLDTTDNHDQNDHNLYMWKSVRRVITGARHAPVTEHAASESDNSAPQKTIIVNEEDAEEAMRNKPDALVVVRCLIKRGDTVEQDPKEEARNILLYAWGVAPDLPAILGTVASAADDWTPREYGAIGAAISSRQQSPATEYVRAFGKLLKENMPDVELTVPIFAAMAGTADVVLNDADNVVTTDAVRKTLIRAVDNST